MPVVCPTITAFNTDDYKAQTDLVSRFAERVHIDLMDGILAPTHSPDLSQIWWPNNLTADLHLMYQHPNHELPLILELRPAMVIFHYEAEVDHLQFAGRLRQAGIKAGLALLQDTSVDEVKNILPEFDQVLVFSGHLGYHGGEADLSLLSKVDQLKALNGNFEIAWDGGINDQNALALVSGGVDVLNVGGFIHSAPDPAQAYAKIKALAGIN